MGTKELNPQSKLERGQENTTALLSVRDETARKLAAKAVKAGLPIGVENRGVIAIWGDGENKKFVDRVAEIKGEGRVAKTLAATLPSAELVRYIDYSLIPADLIPIFSHADELSKRLGSLCFIRIPITEKAADILPASMVLRTDGHPPILQNWDPRGQEPTEELIKEMIREGIRYPSATSMNKSGTPEIVDRDEGYKFSQKEGIPIFLSDPEEIGAVKGSYTIFSIKDGLVKLERDGNIPAELFEKLFGTKINRENYKPSNYAQYPFPNLISDMTDPHTARDAILAYVHTGKVIK